MYHVMGPVNQSEFWSWLANENALSCVANDNSCSILNNGNACPILKNENALYCVGEWHCLSDYEPIKKTVLYEPVYQWKCLFYMNQ
jgi:hypothetical protein